MSDGGRSNRSAVYFWGNYIHDGTVSPFAAGMLPTSWQVSPAPRPILRTRLSPGVRRSYLTSSPQATDLDPLRGTASPHRCVRASWRPTSAQAMWNQGNISPWSTRAGMPTWRGGRGVNGRCQRADRAGDFMSD